MGRRTTGSRTGRALVAAFALLATAGCYEHTFTVGAGAPAGPMVYDRWEHFWLAGLIGHTKMEVDEICPSGDATIETKQTFLNGLVSGLTSGIFTPLTLQIRCRGGNRGRVLLSEEDVAQIVRSREFLEEVETTAPERLEEVRDALEDVDR
jgi:hypothetical protein